jgi:hypothetical protein
MTGRGGTSNMTPSRNAVQIDPRPFPLLPPQPTTHLCRSAPCLVRLLTLQDAGECVAVVCVTLSRTCWGLSAQQAWSGAFRIRCFR